MPASRGRSYEREAAEIARRREASPRAADLQDRLFDRMVQAGRDHRLETAVVSLGALMDHGLDVGDIEARYFESLLSEVA